MMGQILFCLTLGWLPAAGVGSLAHFILPSITLGANILASQLRMTRTSMLDVIKQDYIRTARAKGADERRVVAHHVLRNGMLPVVTQVGISFASVSYTHLFARALPSPAAAPLSFGSRSGGSPRLRGPHHPAVSQNFESNRPYVSPPVGYP